MRTLGSGSMGESLKICVIRKTGTLVDLELATTLEFYTLIKTQRKQEGFSA